LRRAAATRQGGNGSILWIPPKEKGREGVETKADTEGRRPDVSEVDAEAIAVDMIEALIGWGRLRLALHGDDQLDLVGANSWSSGG